MPLEVEKARDYLAADFATYRDPKVGYPANHFAFIKARQRFATNRVKSLIEVGVGHGFAIPVFTAEGIEMSGFDNKPELVTESKERALEFGQNPDQFIEADIEKPPTYANLAGVGEFDALVAMGVLPHVSDDDRTLTNMAELVKPGGEVVIEFRNSLFSLFTFNRFTREFILEDLLSGASDRSRAIMDLAISEKIDINKPGPSSSAFHNPFEVEKTFQRLGFIETEILPFHYHAFLPSQESMDPQEFRDQSMALENETSGWRGLFLCSAYIVHAKTPMH